MVYIKLSSNVVTEVIPEFNPAFPDVPIQQRYAPDFVASLVKAPDDVGLHYIYNKETGTFTKPEPIVIEEPEVENEDVTEEITDSGLTQAEVNLDFDYRLTCLELGI